MKVYEVRLSRPLTPNAMWLHAVTRHIPMTPVTYVVSVSDDTAFASAIAAEPNVISTHLVGDSLP